jgi:hypothetical protein
VILNDKHFGYNTPFSSSVIKHGVPQGLILGPLLLFFSPLCINDLPKIMNNTVTNSKSKMVLFADDTSIIVTNPDPINFIKVIDTVFKHINEWFNANLLTLNFDKTSFVQFIT